MLGGSFVFTCQDTDDGWMDRIDGGWTYRTPSRGYVWRKYASWKRDLLLSLYSSRFRHGTTLVNSLLEAGLASVTLLVTLPARNNSRLDRQRRGGGLVNNHQLTKEHANHTSRLLENISVRTRSAPTDHAISLAHSRHDCD
jgi:hypothetical protein